MRCQDKRSTCLQRARFLLKYRRCGSRTVHYLKLCGFHRHATQNRMASRQDIYAVCSAEPMRAVAS